MAERGREEAHARTAGRRKRTAVAAGDEIVVPPPSNVTALPGVTLPGPPAVTYVVLIGTCGHVLQRVHSAAPAARYLRMKVGRRVTCMHDDCRIPPHAESDADCEYVTGAEVERRCQARWRWDTPMGKVCTRHRNHYVREGYLEDGTG
jgi:hypothetical protein